MLRGAQCELKRVWRASTRLRKFPKPHVLRNVPTFSTFSTSCPPNPPTKQVPQNSPKSDDSTTQNISAIETQQNHDNITEKSSTKTETASQTSPNNVSPDDENATKSLEDVGIDQEEWKNEWEERKEKEEQRRQRNGQPRLGWNNFGLGPFLGALIVGGVVWWFRWAPSWYAQRKLKETFEYNPEFWTERKDVEKELQTFIDEAKEAFDDKDEVEYPFLVEWGPRGSGKTSLWKKLLRGRKGVLHAELNGSEDPDSVVRKIIEELGVESRSQHVGAPMKFIAAQMKRAGQKNGCVSILVLHVSAQTRGREFKEAFLNAISEVGKILSHDHKACMVLIDISPRPLGDVFSREPRLGFYRVGEFKCYGQAHDFVAKKFETLNDVQKQVFREAGGTIDKKELEEKVFPFIGTAPRTLSAYLTKDDLGKRGHDLVVNDIKQAADDYQYLIDQTSQYTKVLPVLGDGMMWSKFYKGAEMKINKCKLQQDSKLHRFYYDGASKSVKFYDTLGRLVCEKRGKIKVPERPVKQGF